MEREGIQHNARALLAEYLCGENSSDAYLLHCSQANLALSRQGLSVSDAAMVKGGECCKGESLRIIVILG